METHYYWPDLAANVREIRRVLKPGGRLVIIAELYRRRPLDLTAAPAHYPATREEASGVLII